MIKKINYFVVVVEVVLGAINNIYINSFNENLKITWYGKNKN